MEQDKKFVILTISDSHAGLDILSSILSPYYDVKVAASVKEALILLKNFEIDLVILDQVNHDINCQNFLISIKAAEETRRIPVILTGNTENPECEELGFALGAADYVSKPFRASIVKVRVNNQRLIVKQIKAIEELSMQDPLTGLPNRRGFDNRIRLEWLRAIREKLNISLAIIDIDYFKAYNDKYGHIKGDVLLQMLAKQIASRLKRPADFVARWGGEEFVVMLPNTLLKGAMALMEEIRQSVQNMVINLPTVTISIGVASVVPPIKASLEDFFNMADKALYQAKNSGRNRVRHYS